MIILLQSLVTICWLFSANDNPVTHVTGNISLLSPTLVRVHLGHGNDLLVNTSKYTELASAYTP